MLRACMVSLGVGRDTKSRTKSPTTELKYVEEENAPMETSFWSGYSGASSRVEAVCHALTSPCGCLLRGRFFSLMPLFIPPGVWEFVARYSALQSPLKRCSLHFAIAQGNQEHFVSLHSSVGSVQHQTHRMVGVGSYLWGSSSQNPPP